MFELFTVKVWGKDLICDICSGDKWYKNTVKTEIETKDIVGQYEEQVRYMFECHTCGNCRLFGMVANDNEAEDDHDVNLETNTVSNLE
ncbi:hypothetical protein [Metabacillus litoralis]|uniref:hypothetical protein n=1 Tax=Metabacillus litoralis TaxID=152268 RepID=UPI001CFDAE08|nr:hypothetical protein [Metabacillus litoralis]